MAKNNSNSLDIITNSVMPGVVGYDLKDTFDTSHIESLTSPIDNFISNGIEINKLFIPNPSPVLGNLIILGYVSAIESYFRAIFRKLILIDDISRAACEKRQISYGAVLFNDDLMLPEALFEDISFAGKKNIIDSLKNFLNLHIQESSIPPDLAKTLNQFNEICELRHCIVHRFGKFGSKNAISLGLTKHLPHIEKPIKCNFTILQQLITICHNTVRITNNLLFEKILTRLIIDGNNKNINPIWKWNYKTDRKKFDDYFNMFYSTLNPPSPTITARDAYKKYHNFYHNF